MADIDELVLKVMDAYNDSDYKKMFATSHNYSLDTFDMFAPQFYEYLLKMLVPENSLDQVHARIQEIRPELKSKVSEILPPDITLSEKVHAEKEELDKTYQKERSKDKKWYDQ